LWQITEKGVEIMAGIRVVHYINQFFAGIGGEEKADTKPHFVVFFFLI